MIRFIKHVVLIGGLCLSAFASADAMTKEEFESEAKQKAMQLGKGLKQNLQLAIKEGGFVSGIEVCKTVAPTIAKQLSTGGWQVGRTALKVRNSQNRPDDWEQSSLLAMVQALEKGIKPGALKTVTINKNAGEYRFMAPIMTDSLCLNCHGAALDPTVKQALERWYPNDEATGFSVGDLRGAVTIRYQSEE